MPVAIPSRLRPPIAPRLAKSIAALTPGPDASERSFVLTISGVHALIHAIELAYAALLLRIEAEFGTDLLLLGVLANVGGFAFGLGALPAGVLVDRLGSIRVLRLSLIGAAGAAMLVAAAPSELVLGGTLALLGVLTGLYHPAGFTLLARTQRRARSVGLHGVIGNLGVASSPVLLTGIALASDWRISYVTLGILAAVAFLYTLRLPLAGPSFARAATTHAAPAAAPPAQDQDRAGPSLADLRATTRRYWWLPLAVVYLANIIQGFVYRGSVTFIPTHIEEQISGSFLGVDGAALAAALSTIALLGGALGWYLGGIAAERFPRYPLVMTLWLALVPLLLLISIASGPLLVLVTFVFVILNFAMAPALVTLVADFSPPGRMGASFGLMFFLSFGLGSFAATLAGFTAGQWGTDAVFIVLALVNAGGALLSGVVLFLTRRSAIQPPARAA